MTGKEIFSILAAYLVARNWIQVCMMGVESRPVDKLIRLLKRELGVEIPVAGSAGTLAAPTATCGGV
ncbi:MAG: hypothetical protein ACWGOX_08965 [Desulforhopalus sp.]